MNVTGDPNQQSRPNIFGQDYNYPLPTPDWDRFADSASIYSQPNFPFCSNFGPAPVTFPMQNGEQYVADLYTPPPIYPSTSQYNFGECRQTTGMLRCKRKTESPPPMPSKQHITEEKMAEHLAKLHISSETPPSNEREEHRTKRLYMCEEMRKLQTDSILPASLLSKIHRPCTALVLWQPPQRLFPLENDSTDNNNEEEVPDHNLMDMDGR